MKDSDVKEVLIDHREALVAYQKIAETQVKLDSSILRRIKAIEVLNRFLSIVDLLLSATIMIIVVKLLL
jgi:hypothetical protein